MGQTITLRASDGHELSAYLATPAGPPRGGLVVVQEIFGVNSHIRAVADGWAADGYLAIAPAVFDRVERGVELGYTEQDVTRGRALKEASGNDKPLLDIDAARAHVAQAGMVGVLGFCWGGLLTWLAAGRLDSFAAAVPYYGGGMPDHAGLAPRCPVLAHFGERDHLIPVERVREFALARPEAQVQVYPADHGFNCDQRGAYDAASAALARERSLAFLRRHVG